jgi:glycosidase
MIDWRTMDRRSDPGTLEGNIYRRLGRLIAMRKEHGAFAGNEMQVVDTGSDHVLGYVRTYGAKRVLVLANFTEQPQRVSGNLLRVYGLGYEMIDLVTGQRIPAEDQSLEPYAFVCLQGD